MYEVQCHQEYQNENMRKADLTALVVASSTTGTDL